MNKLGIFGSTGRIGNLINLIALSHKDIDSVIPYKRDNKIEEFLQSVDFVIDFSLPEGTEILLKAMLKLKKVPILIGTTALGSDTIKLIKELSPHIPIMHAPNVSLGANLMAYMVEKISSILGTEYDTEIIDIHHKKKKDAPSGTALMLRNSISRTRKPEEISINSIRAGTVSGEHIVSFYGDYEVLSVTHRVDNKEVFAKSAINVALWLQRQKPGIYTMQDYILNNINI